MKEVSSTGTLSAQGQCSDPRKLAPVLALCVHVCFPTAPLPHTLDKIVRNFFPLSLFLRHQSIKVYSSFLFLFERQSRKPSVPPLKVNLVHRFKQYVDLQYFFSSKRVNNHHLIAPFGAVMKDVSYCLRFASVSNRTDRKFRWGQEMDPETSAQVCQFERL